ncbi:MAG: hypothetical protein GEU78_18615 [Actinobacteria bacterium]|nr:hypothetical protein [Actinomycetota bacterium]
MNYLEPRLPGVDPIATVSLTAYLHADGFMSHYEVEARGPTGALVRFRAQGSGGPFSHDPAWVTSSAYATEVIRQALDEVRGIYRPLDWPLGDEDVPGGRPGGNDRRED